MQKIRQQRVTLLNKILLKDKSNAERSTAICEIKVLSFMLLDRLVVCACIDIDVEFVY